MRRLLALAALLLAGLAAAQAVGDPLADFLDAAGAAPAAEEGAWTAGGATLRPAEAGGLLAGLELETALDEAGVAAAARTLAIATGYGAGIEAPLAEFLAGNAADLAGAGAQAVGVEGYRLHVEVRGEAPYEATLRLELPRAPADAFGPPVASRGAADAEVVVREFSDFQCPYCRQFALSVLPALEEGLLASGAARFDFHHFPLVSIHANAAPAAEAAQCVADAWGDDAFWAFHDLLFERQAAWSGLSDAEPYLARLAAELPDAALGEGAEAPRERVAACLEAGEGAPAVEAALDRARVLGLSGTPTVFVGGYRVANYGDPAEYARLARLERAVAAESGE